MVLCCRLGGGLSGETKKPTSPRRSSLENGNVSGLALPFKKYENFSPQGHTTTRKLAIAYMDQHHRLMVHAPRKGHHKKIRKAAAYSNRQHINMKNTVVLKT
jgi:hypothetical protein